MQKFTIDNSEVPDGLGRHWLSTGIYFGYPMCCIAQFINGYPDKTAKNGDVSQGYGFIPCDLHAQQIRDGKTNLEKIITERVCPTPFPNSGR